MMESIINDLSVEAKTRSSFSIFVALGATALVVLFLYEEGRVLFNWQEFNSSRINIIIFLLFLCISFFWWVKLLDRSQQLKIDADGIWHRKTSLPFSSLHLIAWKDVYFFYIEEKTRRGVSGLYLVIRPKSSEKEKKVELSYLDKPASQILTVVNLYARLHNIKDLGKEVLG